MKQGTFDNLQYIQNSASFRLWQALTHCVEILTRHQRDTDYKRIGQGGGKYLRMHPATAEQLEILRQACAILEALSDE